MNLTRSTRRSKMRSLKRIARMQRRVILCVASILSCLTLIFVGGAASMVNPEVLVDNKISYTSDIAFEKNPNETEFYIRTYSDLQVLAELVNSNAKILGTNYFYADANYLVMNDITFPDGEEMVPIGTDIHPFRGKFDGAGHKVSGVSISEGSKNIGLFGYAINARITNLYLGSGEIVIPEQTVASNIGGLVGYAKNSIIDKISSEIVISAPSSENVGGVAGYVIDSHINEVAGMANVSGGANVGGLIGRAETSSTAQIGVGLEDERTILEYGVVAGNVSGITNVAGIIGVSIGYSPELLVRMGNIYSVARVSNHGSSAVADMDNTYIAATYTLVAMGGHVTPDSETRSGENMSGANMTGLDSSYFEYVSNQTGVYNLPRLKSLGVGATLRKITYNVDGGTMPNRTGNDFIYTTFYKSNDEVELAVPTRPGYEFVGWKEGENFVEANSFETNPRSVELKAVWSVLSPEPTLLTDAANNTITYGETINIYTTFENNESHGISYSISWKKDGVTISGSDKKLTLTDLVPKAGGYKFEVFVTATDQFGNSATGSADITVYVNKRTAYIFPSVGDITYGSTAEDIREEIIVSKSGLIGGDSFPGDKFTGELIYTIWSADGQTQLGNETIIEQGLKVGSYSMNFTGIESDYYEIVSNPVEFKIVKRIAEIRANSKEKTYDGSPLTEAGYQTANIISIDEVTATTSGTITAVGEVKNVISSYTIKRKSTGEDISSCYQIVKVDGVLRVNAQYVAIDVEATITYGEKSSPEILVNYTGNADADIIKNLHGEEIENSFSYKFYNFTSQNGNIVLGAEITNLSQILVGTYLIHVTSSSTNFDIEFKSNLNGDVKIGVGFLHVTQRNITITVDGGSWTYDGNEHYASSYHVSSGSFAENDGFNVAKILLSSTKNVGADVATITNLDDSDIIVKNGTTPARNSYNITLVNGILNILPKKLEISVQLSSNTFVYGGTVPEVSLSYSGFVSGENQNTAGVVDLSSARYAISSALQGLINPQTGELSGNIPVGTYSISVSNIFASNYEIDSYIPATLVVTKATFAPSISWDDENLGTVNWTTPEIGPSSVHVHPSSFTVILYRGGVEVTRVTYLYDQGFTSHNFAQNIMQTGAGTYTVSVIANVGTQDEANVNAGTATTSSLSAYTVTLQKGSNPEGISSLSFVGSGVIQTENAGKISATFIYGHNTKTTVTIVSTMAGVVGGYTFSNWVLTAQNTTELKRNGIAVDLAKNAIEFDLPEEDITLTANTKIVNEYEVTFETNGGTLVAGYPTKYKVNETLTLPSISRTGYTFAGWKLTSTAGIEADGNISSWTTLVNNIYDAGHTFSLGNYGNITFTAIWNAQTYRIVFNTATNWDGVGTPQTIADILVTYNDPNSAQFPDITFYADPNADHGYTLTGWRSEKTAKVYNIGDSLQDLVQDEIDRVGANKTIYVDAVWQAWEYTLIIQGDAGVNFKLQEDGAWLDYLEIEVQTAYISYIWLYIEDGYTLTDYLFDGSMVAVPIDESILQYAFAVSNNKENSTLRVTLISSPNNYDVTFNANGGSWSGEETKVVVQTFASAYNFPTVEPSRAGYEFLGWFTESVGGTEITASSIVQVTNDDQVLYAHWQNITYNVKFIAGSGSNLKETLVEGLEYDVIELVDLTDLAIAGYRLTGIQIISTLGHSPKYGFVQNSLETAEFGEIINVKGKSSIFFKNLADNNDDVVDIALIYEIIAPAFTVTGASSVVYGAGHTVVVNITEVENLSYSVAITGSDDRYGTQSGRTFVYETNTAVGTYEATIVIEVSGVYATSSITATATSSLEVTKATLIVSKNPDSTPVDKTITYSETSSHTISFSGFKNGETISVLTGYNKTTEEIKNEAGVVVGSASVSLTENTYTISTPATLLAGTYTITLKGLSSENYDFEVPTFVLKVDKKAVTATAASASKTYDGTVLVKYEIGSVAGLVNGDQISTFVISGQQTNVGSSDNVLSSVVIKNGHTDVTSSYEITFVNGSLTVTKRAISLTPVSVTKVYDGTALVPEFYTISSGSLASGEQITAFAFTSQSSRIAVGTTASLIEKSSVVIKNGSTDTTSNYDITVVENANGIVITKAEFTATVEWSTTTGGLLTWKAPQVAGESPASFNIVLSKIPVGGTESDRTVVRTITGLTAYSYNNSTGVYSYDLANIVRMAGSGAYNASLVAVTGNASNIDSSVAVETTPDLYAYTLTVIKDIAGISEVKIEAADDLYISSDVSLKTGGIVSSFKEVTARGIVTTAPAGTANNSYYEFEFRVGAGGTAFENGKTYKLTYNSEGGLGRIVFVDQNGTESTEITYQTGRTYRLRVYTNVSGSTLANELSYNYSSIRIYNTADAEKTTLLDLYNYFVFTTRATYIYGTGADVTIEAEADSEEFSGYEFAVWEIDPANGLEFLTKDGEISYGLTDALTKFILPAKNVTLRAVSKVSSGYDISYDANGGTLVGDVQTTYTVTDTIVLPNITRPGHVFGGWELVEVTAKEGETSAADNRKLAQYLGDIFVAGAIIEDGQTGHAFFKAVWTPITYNVTYRTSQGTATYEATYGVPFSIPAPTMSGYLFAGWKGTDINTSYAYYGSTSACSEAWTSTSKYVNYSPAYFLNLSTTQGATVTLTATWTPDKYEVSFDANGGLFPSGDDTFEIEITYNSNYSLPNQTPFRNGYKFASWNTSPDGSGTTITTSIKMDKSSNHSIYAIWTPIEYTIELVSYL